MRAVHSILGAPLLTCILHVVDAEAASINIVALGASQTAGRGNGRHSGGVSPEQAFPAQLESMLRARGYDAQVTNAGVAGDTTDGMLARLDSSVPTGTKLVILQPGTNDGKHGASAGASVNVPQIIQKLKARGIKVIIANMRSAAADVGPDGQHLTAHGQTVVAEAPASPSYWCYWQTIVSPRAKRQRHFQSPSACLKVPICDSTVFTRRI